MNLSAQFKTYLLSKANPASKATVKNYISDINRFIAWFEAKFDKEFSPSEVSIDLINNFQTECKDKYSASSIERSTSSLRKFFSFLKLESYVSHSPFEAVKPRENDIDPWKIRDFKNYLYVLNASPLTMKNYVIDVKQFKAWAEATIPHDEWNLNEAKNILSQIDSRLINDYKNRLLTDLHLSPVSVNRKLSSLRRYTTWAKEEGIIKPYIQVINEPKLTTPDALALAMLTAESIPQAEAKKEYSKLPPVRVAQKSKAGLGMMLDAAVIAPIALGLNKFDHALWVAKGKPVFDTVEVPSSPLTSILEPMQKADGPVRNVPKSFYAPTHISTANFPLHKKAIHHARYSRPDWYRKYHSYTFVSYLHFSILMIILSVIGYMIFNNMNSTQKQKESVLASIPAAPNRHLAFQGRITDAQGAAINKNTTLRIAIYNNQTSSGSALLWQEVINTTPDSDGIFNIMLGKSTPIPSTLFSQNTSLWLGVTVGRTQELKPRQPIATVAFASNAETLQGLPPITATTATANVVLALNSSGNLTIGGRANPTFQATGGTFTLAGNILMLTTNAGSNGNVVLSPNGTGIIDVQKALVNTTSEGTPIAGAVTVNDVFIVNGGSTQQGLVGINQTSSGDLITASTSSSTRFRVDNGGNVIANGSFNGLSISNGTVTSGTWNGTAISPTYGGTGLNTSASTGVPYISSGTWSVDANALAANHGGTGLTSYTNGSILYANGSSSLTTLAIGSNGECLVSNGSTPTWSACSGTPGDSIFNEIAGLIYPDNTNADFAIGGNSTESAKFAIINVNSARGSQTASVSGGLTLDSGSANISTTQNQSLSFGGASTGLIQFNNSAGSPFATFNPTTSKFGIGTDNPDYSIDIVNGSADASIRLKDTANSLEGIFTTGGASIDIGSITNNPVIFYTNNDAKIRLSANGGLSFGTNYSDIDANQNELIVENKVGIGSSSPIATLDVRSTTSNLAIASISGQTSSSALIVDNSYDEGDIFTASKSGKTHFVIDKNGNVGIGTNSPQSKLEIAGVDGFNLRLTPGAGSISETANILINNRALFSYNGSTQTVEISDNGSSKDINILSGGSTRLSVSNSTGIVTLSNGLTLTTGPINLNGSNGSSNQCLIGGSSASWGACGGGTNYWQIADGAISPVNNTLDLLIGDQSTTSAKFAIINVNGSRGLQTASISGGLTLDSTSNSILQTTNNRSLSINPNGGNIGIGTSTPAQNLAIVNKANSPATMLLQGGTTGQGATVTLTSPGYTSATMSLVGTNYQLEHVIGNAKMSLFSYRGYNDSRDAYAGFNNELTIGSSYYGVSTSNLNGLRVQGNVGIGTSTVNATLDVRSNTLNLAIASVSGSTSFAALNIDQRGTGDILTASAGGVPRFSITNTGGIKIGQLQGTAGDCLLSGGAGASVAWGSCGGGTNYWQQNNGALSPFSNTLDLLVGGTSTSSSKFAVIGVNGTTPVASVSATGTNSLILSGSGNIQSASNNTLTIGGNTTGNISLSPNNGQGTVLISQTIPNTDRANSALYVTQASNISGGDNSAALVNFENLDVASGTLLSLNQQADSTVIGLSTSSTWQGTILDATTVDITTGFGLRFDGSSVQSGKIIDIAGSLNLSLGGDFTGSYISINPTRQLSSGSITRNDTGNFINLARNNANASATSTFNVTGDIANFSSTCSGACVDTSNILELNQQYNRATGAVLNIVNSGVGSAAAILSNSGGQSALIINKTGNSGDIFTASSSGTTKFTVDLNGSITSAGTGNALTLSGAATTAINITNTGVTTDISLQNNETISNNTDGLVQFNGALGSDFNMNGSTATFPSTQGFTLGWNYSSGQGEVDLITRQGAGASGGFRVYDWDGVTATLMSDVKPNGTVSFPLINTSAGVRTVCSTAGGSFTINNGACGTSSLRYKHDIQNLTYGLDEINKIRPVSFIYNDYDPNNPGGRTARRLGFIAEEMSNIIPEVVVYNPDGSPETIDYAFLTSLLVKGIQEQQLQINDLKTNLQEMDSSERFNLNNSGEIAIVPTVDDSFEVKRSSGEKITRVGVFSDLIVAKIKAGYLELGRLTVTTADIALARIGELTVNTATIAFAQIGDLSTNSLAIASENISIAGVGIRDYIYSIVDERISGKQIAISAPIIEADIIKPSEKTIAIKLPTNDKSSKVTITNASNSAVATIDAEGNASFSGELAANGITTNDATISGTLRAGKIIADDIELSEDLLAKIEGIAIASPSPTTTNNYISNNYYYNSSSNSSSSSYPNFPSGTGTGSATLAGINADFATFTNGLMAFGPSSFFEASVSDRLFVGAQLSISDRSINVLGADLEIQPLKQGGIAFVGGQVKIDVDGNLKVGGNAVFAKNVEIGGKLSTGIIAPIPGKDLVFQFKDSDSDEDAKVEFKTGTGSAVLSFNDKGDVKASGSGTFNKLNLSFIPKAIAVNDTEVIATGSAGTTEIKPYKNELTIKNPLVTKDSLIYITPKTGTPNQSVYLLRQVPGESFTVGISKAISKSVPFNWILIN